MIDSIEDIDQMLFSLTVTVVFRSDHKEFVVSLCLVVFLITS